MITPTSLHALHANERDEGTATLSKPLAPKGRTAVKLPKLKDCTVARFQRICCALFMRLATIALTALSTNAVEIGSPRRLRAA